MPDAEPNLVISHLSRRVECDGHVLSVEIYRLDDRPGWQLEVVTEDKASTLWPELFDTDREADLMFRDTLAAEGVGAFVEDHNVVPFTRPRT